MSWVLALALAFSACGCGYYVRSPIRPVPALAFQRDPDVRARCLVVFLPGLMDGPETIRDRALPSILGALGSPCDSVAVDATYRYYFGSHIDEPIYEDVLVPALARGYEEIWLVGVSLGGIGAIMTARAHPRLIEGVIVLSPFLGLENVVREIEAAGGLEAWDPPDPVPELHDSNFTTVVWAWLRGYVTDPDAMPELWVGWANGERLEPGAAMLAAVAGEGHSMSVDGSHGWASWTPLFTELARRARIGAR
jgi:pimeloyl-ACP methyl ester carboxylesterase